MLGICGDGRPPAGTRATSTTSVRGPRGHLSVLRVQVTALKRCSNLAEPFGAQLASVRELVASIPAPRLDHRQHQDPALAEQVVIDAPVVLADFFGRVGEVEFDRSIAARLEVYEQQPALCGEHVAWVRLAVQ